jgi:hypothetical protein
MAINLRPTEEQRLILERLQLPGHIGVMLREPTIALDPHAAETVREALTEEMARRGFDADYEPNAEGVVIEGLIDVLFVS